MTEHLFGMEGMGLIGRMLESRVKDKAGGGRRKSTIFLGID